MTATGADRARRAGQTARLVISVSSPFRLDYVVWALRRRAHNQVGRFDGGRYWRVLCLGGESAEVTVRQDASAAMPSLVAELPGPAGRAGRAAVAEAGPVPERMLGLAVDLDGFCRAAAGDARLNALAARFRGMRPLCFPTVFEAVVNAAACQQLSLDVGIHLLSRLARRFGPAVPGPVTRYGFPAPGRLAAANPAELRGLARYHLLPGDDVGARNNLRRGFGLAEDAGYDAVAGFSRRWWPHGGLVYFHLLLDTLAARGYLEEAR
jgi:hypothetical protein